MARSARPAERFRLWVHRSQEAPHQHAATRAIYLRLLGLVLFIAFVSFWVQLEGLVGERGILPVSASLRRYWDAWGYEAWWRIPTLAWLWPSAGAAHLLCLLGSAASLVVMAGRAQAVALAVCWVSYLSLFYTAQRWLGFQWDLLLLEVAFLSIFLAPWRLRARQIHDAAAPRFILWLHWWLLARLMFSSGIGKLLGGDDTWRDLTALDYHFWTQPLPNTPAVWAHDLGPGLHSALVVVTLFCQLVAPGLLLLGRRGRAAGGVALLCSQLGIVATGNFAYFNLLSLALIVLVFDDAQLQRVPLLRAWLERADAPLIDARPAPRLHRPMARAVAVLILFLSAVQMLSTLHVRAAPQVLFEAADVARPLRLVSGYGLFTRMTTTRLEIEIEGSDDGRTWKPYVFPYKPGPLDRRPSQVAPHQPRLDWQMWFAALGQVRRNPWLVKAMRKILEGEPAVLGLFEVNPFPDRPPRYLRAMGYDYRFATPDERAKSGHWWTRTPKGLYAPTLQRRD